LVYIVPPPNRADGITIVSDVSGGLSVKPGGVTALELAPRLPKIATISTVAGAGAVLGTLSATAGYAFDYWGILCFIEGVSTGSDVRLRLTYTDDTTETLFGSSLGNTAEFEFRGCPGVWVGLQSNDLAFATMDYVPIVGTAAKLVKKIEVVSEATGYSYQGKIWGTEARIP